MLTICSTRLSVSKLLDTKDTSANYVESTIFTITTDRRAYMDDI